VCNADSSSSSSLNIVLPDSMNLPRFLRGLEIVAFPNASS
jgi:hypothetical protein